MTIETISETNCFGGRIGFYRHKSAVNRCDMRFSVFVPPQAAAGRKLPVLTFLSGLTCSEENFMVKSGAQRVAARLGLILVSPDTSPRPWSHHYHMYDYITKELPVAIFGNFPADPDRHGLTGHSMGGHGALVIGLRNPQSYRSLSAFAPISTTLHSPWGQKALGYYLGADTATWHEYDACEVARNARDVTNFDRILVDQGADDPYLEEQLQPERLADACRESGLPLDLRLHQGYDHGYYFISTFIEEHLEHHAERLTA